MDFFDSEECTWKDMKVLIAGKEVSKITNVKYKVSQEITELMGAGDEPIGLQEGNRRYEGQMTLYKGAVDDMNRAAKLAGGRDILDTGFDIVVVYEGNDVNRGLQTDTLIGVRVMEYEKGWDQGAPSMPVTLPMKFMRKVSQE